MATDKSTWNKKQKVSQSTIDSIKRLGMTKALKLAKQNAGAYQAGLVAEYQEATRRMYGDKRFAAATGTASKKTTNKISNPRQADKPEKVKVSQGMIDAVKSMGMKRALGMLDEYSNPKVKNISGNKVYMEAVRRLYGETRFQNNLYKPKNSPGINTPAQDRKK